MNPKQPRRSKRLQKKKAVYSNPAAPNAAHVDNEMVEDYNSDREVGCVGRVKVWVAFLCVPM